MTEKTSIKSLCEKFNLSQSEVSKKFEIPYRTVQDWYSGRRVPPEYVTAMIEQICTNEQLRKDGRNMKIIYNAITSTSFVCSDASNGPLDFAFLDVWL